MEPTKSEPSSESTEIYRAVRCLFFWGLWSTGLVFLLLNTDVLRTDSQATTRTLKLAEALIKSHATNTTTCTPIYESASLANTTNFYWRFTCILNLCLILFGVPIAVCYPLMTEYYNPDNYICLRCFFGLSIFFGFIICASLDKELSSLDGGLILPTMFSWVTNFAMTMALFLAGGYRAVWHTFCDVRFLGLWVKVVLSSGNETDLEKQKP
ncbi:hypothetical protein MMC17_000285 [Xylographa soralifera]|nr:hypothetical protein [Xylographa soralifera]